MPQPKSGGSGQARISGFTCKVLILPRDRLWRPVFVRRRSASSARDLPAVSTSNDAIQRQPAAIYVHSNEQGIQAFTLKTGAADVGRLTACSCCFQTPAPFQSPLVVNVYVISRATKSLRTAAIFVFGGPTPSNYTKEHKMLLSSCCKRAGRRSAHGQSGFRRPSCVFCPSKRSVSTRSAAHSMLVSN